MVTKFLAMFMLALADEIASMLSSDKCIMCYLTRKNNTASLKLKFRDGYLNQGVQNYPLKQETMFIAT